MTREEWALLLRRKMHLPSGPANHPDACAWFAAGELYRVLALIQRAKEKFGAPRIYRLDGVKRPVARDIRPRILRELVQALGNTRTRSGDLSRAAAIQNEPVQSILGRIAGILGNEHESSCIGCAQRANYQFGG